MEGMEEQGREYEERDSSFCKPKIKCFALSVMMAKTKDTKLKSDTIPHC